MIGTMVVSLPAKHEGGEVHLSHAGKRHVFATSESSALDLAALAWYSDVTHAKSSRLSQGTASSSPIISSKTSALLLRLVSS